MSHLSSRVILFPTFFTFVYEIQTELSRSSQSSLKLFRLKSQTGVLETAAFKAQPSSDNKLIQATIA